MHAATGQDCYGAQEVPVLTLVWVTTFCPCAATALQGATCLLVAWLGAHLQQSIQGRKPYGLPTHPPSRRRASTYSHLHSRLLGPISCDAGSATAAVVITVSRHQEQHGQHQGHQGQVTAPQGLQEVRTQQAQGAGRSSRRDRTRWTRRRYGADRSARCLRCRRGRIRQRLTDGPNRRVRVLSARRHRGDRRGQRAYTSSSAAFGAGAVAAEDLDIYICYRPSGSGAEPTSIGTDFSD